MPLYEHIYLARQDVSPQQVEELTNALTEVLTQGGGKVTKNEYWGLKSLSYRIRKNRKAHYSLHNIDAPAPAVAEMERQMRINEDILRFMTVRVDELADQLVMRLHLRVRTQVTGQVVALFLRALQRRENGRPAGVVLLRERLELVIVAPRAPQRHAQKGRRSGPHNVVELIVAVHQGIGRLVVPGSQPQHRGGDLRGGVGTLDLVARQLLDRELVVRHVRVERANHPIAIRPHVSRKVFFIAFGVGVAGQIKPHAGPMFAEAGRGQ